jgi:hypothetical protein
VTEADDAASERCIAAPEIFAVKEQADTSAGDERGKNEHPAGVPVERMNGCHTSKMRLTVFEVLCEFWVFSGIGLSSGLTSSPDALDNKRASNSGEAANAGAHPEVSR